MLHAKLWQLDPAQEAHLLTPFDQYEWGPGREKRGWPAEIKEKRRQGTIPIRQSSLPAPIVAPLK